MRCSMVCAFVCIAGSGLVAGIAPATADGCTAPLGRLMSVEGRVEVQPAGTAEWRLSTLGEPLCAGDLVRVGSLSRAAAALANDNKLRMDENTTLRLIGPINRRRTLLEMLTGSAYFFSRRPQSLDVTTPAVNAAVEGTEFLVRITAGETLLGVVHGHILARNDRGELQLGDGDSAVTTATTAPAPFLLLRPLDAVAWALHYPSILPFLPDPGAEAFAKPPEDLRQAIAAAARGRADEAFAHFAKVPEAARAADYYVYRAAALLGVGRADEAEADIRLALANDPASAAAHGLSAVIRIARNDTAGGLAQAERAVEVDPASAPAAIALSYALQAQFRIEAAREAAERAVKAAPGNPLAWARLSELWLMLGWRARSREAAERALELAPAIERVHTVGGFAALTAFDTRRARQEFEAAIDIDSGNPQARLGLGLARIRDGNLREGRDDIELAVLLDPNNALLRSYLGKAYFEEKRDPLASDQYQLAKELGPNDPTEFFYDAILKQTQNRPVEALRDLETSISLNDDRALYRSRELLDSDRAARGASLGRIYDDLGFQQLGINEATRSLTFDPANASAHRFLSDVYVTEPRREIARVSELLQAQLLQDVNIDPVQPSLAVTNFNIITHGGPARPGFNEFNPLFEGNQARLNLTGVLGDHETRGNEAVVSGLYGRYSLSVGQFHYETDGFRDNNGVNSDIYNAFAQAAVTPEFNLQTELRREENKSGFLPILFDPDNVEDAKFRSEQDSARVGGRYTLNPDSTLIGSLIFSDGRFDQDFATDGSDGYLNDRVRGYQAEAGHIFSGSGYDIVSGSSLFYVQTDRTTLNPPSNISLPASEQFDTHQQTAYLYSYIKPSRDLLATLGFSFDHYTQSKYDLFKVNPKLGVQWSVLPNVLLRAGVFRVVKPPFVTNRTIQPTQVAGFNQFFDDPDGTESWRYGAGLDARFSRDLSGGIEGSQRRLQENLRRSFGELRGLEDAQEDRREQFYRTYLYWTPHPELALSAQLAYDKYQSQQTAFGLIPTKVTTWSAPVSARFFHPSGFFSILTCTFVRQDVTYPGPADNFEGDSQFVLLDAAVGYRLPGRLGVISLQGMNLLNNGFKHQDDSFREFTADPVVSRFIPERTIVGRVSLNF